MTYRVLDLFSGIGGFSLGLERTGGFETVAFCEIEEWPRRILAKHWPDVPIYTDVRELTYERLHADRTVPDIITAGFPCQDISVAGKGAGIEGERSGLWSEVARLTGELRPRYVILENVSALLGRGLDKVLGDLAQIGYDAEWHCIPASSVGAPHRRDRFWAVAYPLGNGGRADAGAQSPTSKEREKLQQKNGETLSGHAKALCGDVAYADQPRLQGRSSRRVLPQRQTPDGHGRQGSGGNRRRNGGTKPYMGLLADGLSAGLSGYQWLEEPGIGRIATGIPDRAKKLKALGNSIVPAIAEVIGNAIITSEQGGER